MVSPRYALHGLILASNLVLELPPNESFKKNVNFESLKGIYFFFLADSTNELITLPSAWSDLLILHPYFNRSPSTLASLVLSLPAKSTTCILEKRDFWSPFSSNSTVSAIEKIVWDLELSLFMEVAAIFLFLRPLSMISSAPS
jgi:hypothetical protein